MIVKFFNVGGACSVLDIDGKVKIGIDPVLNPQGTKYDFKIFKSKRIKSPLFDKFTFHNIKIWLITHGHADHIDPAGVAVIDRQSKIVVEKSALEFFLKEKYGNLFELAWGKTKYFNMNDYGITIEAIPAIHASNFVMSKLIGKVNGYYISIIYRNERKDIYITSDTIYHKKVIKALAGKKVDILVANLGQVWKGHFGGPLTMSTNMLQKFVNKLKPQKVIPLHYDDFSHYNISAGELNHAGFTIYEQGKWITV